MSEVSNSLSKCIETFVASLYGSRRRQHGHPGSAWARKRTTGTNGSGQLGNSRRSRL